MLSTLEIIFPLSGLLQVTAGSHGNDVGLQSEEQYTVYWPTWAISAFVCASYQVINPVTLWSTIWTL